FETWIAPRWNGLDNNAELSFLITKNGSPISLDEVFIGANEEHVDVSGLFSLNKNSIIYGTPNKKKDGLFIYYDIDNTKVFDRWYLDIIDGYSSSVYKIKITSTGNMYDVRKEGNHISMFTGTNSINMTIPIAGDNVDEGISFISDINHFILDAGKEATKNRFSIFKDPSGYLNFRIFDKDGLGYTISANVSSWKAEEFH